VTPTHHEHLLEERLLDCYLAERNGETADPRIAEQLLDCETCTGRYSDLAAFMDALNSEGAAESDAIFTAERLRAQQQQIARRLEHVGHSARVLSFPQRLVRGTMTPVSGHSAPRWVAAAAAAGLFIGVAVGASYTHGYGSRPPMTQVAVARQMSPAPASSPIATRADSAAPADDADLMIDLETAMERPHTRELLAFDALTPHVREVGLRR
jgi:hypothetical protein